MSITLATATVDDFRPLVGARFSIELAPGVPSDAVLVEAEETRFAQQGAPRRAFSLLFRLAPGLALAQGIHPVEHPAIGRLEVFLTVQRPTHEGTFLEAIFA
jgi:hypothetical protein